MHIITKGNETKFKFKTKTEVTQRLETAYAEQIKIGLDKIWTGIITQTFGDVQDTNFTHGKKKGRLRPTHGKRHGTRLQIR